MAENFLKLLTDTKPQIQEAQREPIKINNKKNYTSISYANGRKSKGKEEILKEARG